MSFSDIISAVNNFVWGPVMLALLMGTGIFLTVRLKFKPWLNLGYALKSVFTKQDKTHSDDSGDISPFQSLMTALAATIGTGNIVGVATAMVLGGPGALVWMWISALFGLSTKYAESVLAVKYRETNAKGEMAGGPMYAMKNGFKNKKIGLTLAFLFSLFATVASFGIGNMTQANSIAGAVNGTFGVPTWITGLILMALAFMVILGGIKSIGRVSGVIVPFMAVFYVLAAILVIIINYQNVPAGIAEIFTMAFSPTAMAGGVGGTIIATMLTAMRWGVARGVFSNEAGLGSAPIAAAAAKTDHPSRQGYINMTGTFFDTIVVCTITGLVIASSGALGTLDASGEILMGANLTIAAFQSALGPVGGYIVTVGITLFAFSTILGWEYYGEKSLEYLIKAPIAVTIYRVLYCLVVFVGATTALEIVWNLSDAMNGMMAIPNLISLLVLSSVVAKECFEFQTDFLIPEKLAFKEAKKK
ncbi:sodium:alanine symporter family protein [Acetobacterium wieringae]|uniref:Sodium:alanine symporter family protein n=1 Tax=Acetobacterium wieringae TaxID=52694 RepID=A0ABY6HH64_9FIRM|nr:sodium:alanine symporter family protein [Acetobacterium wieringae]MEA4805895.1 sodium:alanine symporter family protein [Acetobacterium wieringae]UYO63875.1 sodium:alanine symporter family protein [Acetobacterium wieringae]VUZ27223.1 Amino-acid carrier protein AlsT [Acetobacterium wieringae]